MKYLVIIYLSLFCLDVRSQDVSLSLQKEPQISAQAIINKWTEVSKELNLGFASSDVRYARELPPKGTFQSTWEAKAWKGEKISTQLLLWAGRDIARITLEVSDLKNIEGGTIRKENISTGFLKYVITDEFKDGCSKRQKKDYDSSYVADIIDTKIASVSIAKNSTQPIWVSLRVPANTKPGSYKGTITVRGDKNYNMGINVKVIDKTLIPPGKSQYDLDLWQHPAAIARVHNVPLWSDEHFSLMKGYYTMLAEAGQKTITASIVNEPWGHQTYDDYPSLVKWIKKKDGTWKYDYRLFDKYVAFVMKCGISERINCYSMVPWKIAFTYFDEALNKEGVFTDAIGTNTYNTFWKTMLVDFTGHLKGKNWFDKTYIAMDERPMEAMKSVIRLLKDIDKNWKIALAGDYHAEIERDIDNYCIASKWSFPDSVLQRRRSEGKISTWYTCCIEPYPNGFTFSSPAESVWIGWYTAGKNMDGYLRWAYNSWTEKPLLDSRFTSWPAGDTYLVYPGPLSSVRFEKLLEGAQDFEKIRYLKSLYKKNGQTDKLIQLDRALKKFEIRSLAEFTAQDMMEETKSLINH
ncbi:DUF4091 domain-containing protein [Pedobacter sp. HDW13]|uniref:DUF4091 domain-containing protein n=1 Tax=Pedobacter sp. HDW13 TaxID=2714940 RepID=UPI0014097688|nr:DUF4091 domain-containing protein [Pedobacter sp. HDW13]QIL38341.1 DUF4091 domain-containing protein [Pedobacter sp. HDW13]